VIQQNNSKLFSMCADQTACCAGRVWFLSLSYILGWAVLHILAPVSLCIFMCFKLHVKNLHQLDVIITKIFRYTLAVHLLILLKQILESCTTFRLLMTPWDCYLKAKYWNQIPQTSKMALHSTQQCTVLCFGAVFTVARVLIRQNVNSKIDGALSEDNFITSLQKKLVAVSMKYLLNKTEHHHTHTHTHCRFCSEQFRCSLLWQNNFELLVQSCYNSVDVTIVLSWHYSFYESFFMKLP